MWYKCIILAIVTTAAFSGTAASVIGAAGFLPQAVLYGKTPIELSYGVSGAIHCLLACSPAALDVLPGAREPSLTTRRTQVSAGGAGVCVGPLFWLPISHKIGRPASIFWGMVLAMACNIWSATMTGHGDYESFIVSRFFAGMTASVAIAGKHAASRRLNV